MYKHTGYTKVLIAILSIVLIVSCAPDPTLEPENQYKFSPERTAAPALTKIPPTPTLTATATTTPTSVPLILQGTPFPTPQEVISNQNADRLTALARWGNGSLNYIALSPDGQFLAAATTISVVLYTADTLEVIKTLLTDSEVNAVSFSIDGKTLAIGTSDGAQLWDLSNEITPLDLSNNESSRVNSLVFSPNGLWLAAGTEDGVLIFDAATGQSLFTLEGGKNLHTDAIAFSSDNKHHCCCANQI